MLCEGTPYLHWRGDLVGPKVGLHILERRKIVAPNGTRTPLLRYGQNCILPSPIPATYIYGLNCTFTFAHRTNIELCLPAEWRQIAIFLIAVVL
jgi:hypothetical protein